MICSRTLLLAAALTIATCSVAWAQTQPKDPFDKGNCPRSPKSQQDIDACSRMIKENQKDPDLYLNRSNGWRAIGNKDRMIDDIQKAIELAPIYWRGWFGRGNYHALTGQHDKAISDFSKAIELDPSHAIAYVGKGNVLHSKGAYDKAIFEYSKAIEVGPQYPVAYKNRGISWQKKGDNGRAMADFNKATELDPRYADAYLDRGVLWQRRGQHDKAIDDFTKAISINPLFSAAYNNRGNSLSKIGDIRKALLDYEKAIELDSKNAAAYSNRGGIWSNRGDWKKAISDYSKAIDLDPGNGDYYNNRGLVWLEYGDFSRSSSDFKRAIQQGADNYIYRYNLGYMHYKEGSLDDAISSFGEAIRLNPADTNSYNRRGIAWAKKDQHDKAIADFDAAIKIDSQDSNLFSNRGISWRSKRENGYAIVDFEQALKLNPSNTNAKEGLALAKAAIEKQKNAATASSRPSTGHRIALVIGNSSYKNTEPLPNPRRDADKVASTLKKAGFDSVDIKLDLTRQQMRDALTEFEKVASQADWAAIYYAGHAIEVSGVNYMMPIDSKVRQENQISEETVNIEYFLNAVETASKLRLVILDACRDNPFIPKVRAASASRSAGTLAPSQVGRGLARIEPQPGTLVVFAAKQGQVALDGDGQNSPFVEALVKRIEQKPALEVRRLFDFVREDVVKATNKEQQPFAYGSLAAGEDFFFSK